MINDGYIYKTIFSEQKLFIQSAVKNLSARKNVNELKVVTLVQVVLETFYNTGVVQELYSAFKATV